MISAAAAYTLSGTVYGEQRDGRCDGYVDGYHHGSAAGQVTSDVNGRYSLP